MVADKVEKKKKNKQHALEDTFYMLPRFGYYLKLGFGEAVSCSKAAILYDIQIQLARWRRSLGSGLHYVGSPSGPWRGLG